MLINNIVTALKNPQIAQKYVRWMFEMKILRRQPQRRIRDSVTIGAFSGFSEYIAVDNFLSDSEFKFFGQYKFPAGAIIDIGANLGVISIFMAKRYPDRRVYAIEPNPYTAVSLDHNLKLNQVSNVALSELAVAERCGKVKFNADPISRGTASISGGGTLTSADVICVTLDAFIEERAIEQVALLKVDVEGYETCVFGGARRALEKLRPAVIYFEICPPITAAAGFDPAAPAKMLIEHGYTLHDLDSHGNIVPVEISTIGKIQYANWIAIAG